MIYTNRNDTVKNKIVTCFPVLMDNKYYTSPENF